MKVFTACILLVCLLSFLSFGDVAARAESRGSIRILRHEIGPIQDDVTSPPQEFPYKPSPAPTGEPATLPPGFPTLVSSFLPSSTPSTMPSLVASFHPSLLPSIAPSVSSSLPSVSPSLHASTMLSSSPSISTWSTPSFVPSYIPTFSSSLPSVSPSPHASTMPSSSPSISASSTPSSVPSYIPTVSSAGSPSSLPSPSMPPSNDPAGDPTSVHSGVPIVSPFPSIVPSDAPSTIPSPPGIQECFLNQDGFLGTEGDSQIAVKFAYELETKADAVIDEVIPLLERAFNTAILPELFSKECVSTKPDDIVLASVACAQKNEETNMCEIVQGELTVFIDRDKDEVHAQIIDILKTGMENDEFVYTHDGIERVTFVILDAGTNSGTGTDDPPTPAPANEPNRNAIYGIIAGLSSLLLILGVFVWRRKQKEENNDETDAHEGSTAGDVGAAGEAAVDPADLEA